MSGCNEIGLMLGAFEDGELEPHEMQEVAFHLARCQACTAEISGIATIGRELRAIAPAPSLAGFAAKVKTRIDNLPAPLTARISRSISRRFGAIGSGLAWGGAIAAVAAMATLLMTPYAERFTNQYNNAAPTVAMLAHDAARVPDEIAKVLPEAIPADDRATLAGDSQAVILRLESEIPSVAVWNEPRTGTPVIWVPDQQQPQL
ncbi:MAG TPA: zf-HC2 domain-containing protein [Candidatus Binataceae bacterium]|nr:zf-HC2 domain-containing protein [Candidatus Binataceae bacterium]